MIDTVFIESLSSSVMKLAGIKDLLHLINLHECKYVFWSQNVFTEPEEISAEEMSLSGEDMVFIMVDGIAMSIQTSQFTDFQEMVNGHEHGFNEGTSFRKAIELGIETGDEYHKFIQSGFKSITDFRTIMKTKVPEVYASWEYYYESLEPKEELADPEDLCSFVELDVLGLCGFSKSKSATIIDAFSKGFWIESDYSAAKKMGFNYSTDFYFALDFEIDNPEELALLRFHGISHVQHWDALCSLIEDINENEFVDAFGFLLLSSIQDQKPGAIIDVRILKKTIAQQVVTKYGIQDGPYYAFAHNMNDMECRTFLCNHKDLKDYIFLSGSQIIRKSFTEQEKKTAIIDVSNVVLFFNDKHEERVADAELLLTLVSALRDLGVEKLIGYADANIHYDISDDDVSRIRKSLDTFQIVQSSEPADIYILKYAQDNPGIIVSNDHYSDWCNDRHPWRIENVPRLLLDFKFDESKKVILGQKEAEF